MDILQELRKASRQPKMTAVKFLKENLDELKANGTLSKQQLHQLAVTVDKQTKAGYVPPKVKKEPKVPKEIKLAKAPTKKKGRPKKASKPKS